MRRFLAFAVCASVLIAACGSSSTSSGGAAPPSTTTSPVTSSGPLPSSGAPGGSGTPRRVVPAHNAANVHPLRFDPSKAVASAGGVLVRFYGGIAPCFVLDHYTVAETTSTVTVTLYAGSDQSKPDAVCAELALEYEVDVPLQAPLGTRRVVDGAT